MEDNIEVGDVGVGQRIGGGGAAGIVDNIPYTRGIPASGNAVLHGSVLRIRSQVNGRIAELCPGEIPIRTVARSGRNIRDYDHR